MKLRTRSSERKKSEEENKLTDELSPADLSNELGNRGDDGGVGSSHEGA